MEHSVFVETDSGVNMDLSEGDRILFWKTNYEFNTDAAPREVVVEEICSTKEFLKIAHYGWIEVKNIVLHQILPFKGERKYDKVEMLLLIFGGIMAGFIVGISMIT